MMTRGCGDDNVGDDGGGDDAGDCVVDSAAASEVQAEMKRINYDSAQSPEIICIMMGL